MSESPTIEFVQIATAKEHLYGMTSQGSVWKYDADRELWEPVSMAFSATPKRRGFEHHQRREPAPASAAGSTTPRKS